MCTERGPRTERRDIKHGKPSEKTRKPAHLNKCNWAREAHERYPSSWIKRTLILKD
jgi:hypothetical protein